MSTPPSKETPGQTLESELQRLEPEMRPGFLRFLDRKAKATGDLELARALKQYRAMSQELRPKPDQDK